MPKRRSGHRDIQKKNTIFWDLSVGKKLQELFFGSIKLSSWPSWQPGHGPSGHAVLAVRYNGLLPAATQPSRKPKSDQCRARSPIVEAILRCCGTTQVILHLSRKPNPPKSRGRETAFANLMNNVKVWDLESRHYLYAFQINWSPVRCSPHLLTDLAGPKSQHFLTWTINYECFPWFHPPFCGKLS